MNLTQSEYNTLRDIILEYKEVDIKLNFVQERLSVLEKEKEKILKEIDSVKNKENVFFENVEKKYGKGKLDIFTSEYILDHDSNTIN